MQSSTEGPLRIGILGSGFIANFHLQALLSVRNARVAGVFSPTPANRLALAKKANELQLGPSAAYDSVESLVESEEVDAVWIAGPNDTRLDHMRAISRAMESGAYLLGVACEKPLARNLAEAHEMLRLAEEANLNHGYLENHPARAHRRSRADCGGPRCGVGHSGLPRRTLTLATRSRHVSEGLRYRRLQTPIHRTA